MTTTAVRFLIIGAGPTGLGAARRLVELGHRDDWLLVERAPTAGGLAGSETDAQGFTWDIGGHVLFSHYEYFDELMVDLLGDAWVEHERESWVWMRERFIPYPFQLNIWRLPAVDLAPCLEGLVHVNQRAREKKPPPPTFRDWILENFGQGIGDVFMFPYNLKVWAYDPRELSVGWLGERVATVDLARVLRNLVHSKDDVSWGPNAKFRFPRNGGTGAIWRTLHARLPEGRVRLGTGVESIDAARREARLSTGETVRYEHLISTGPLDLLIQRIGRPDLAALAPRFKHSSSNIVGIGMEGTVPPELRTKCWMYFPEDDNPFYRATVFSNYSPENVPDAKRFWSLMFEVAESPAKPVDTTRMVESVIQGAFNTRLIAHDARIVSKWYRRLEHGYPTPFVGRDELLRQIDPELRKLGIWSRGRFGAWKYEVSNQDHSLMQGVEAVDHILSGAHEETYDAPDLVNGRRNPNTRRVSKVEDRSP